MSGAEKALDRTRRAYAARPTYENLCALEKAERRYERAWSAERSGS